MTQPTFRTLQTLVTGWVFAARRTIRGMVRSSGTDRHHAAFCRLFMESCFGTIKTELELCEYAGSRAAMRELAGYVSYDNVSRRHSSLGYLTPTEFEANHTHQPHPE